MLRVHSLPGSLMRVLEPFRPCFTTPTFETFVTLVAGMIARPGQRTVCGMLAGAGLVRAWHHSRGAPVLRRGPLGHRHGRADRVTADRRLSGAGRRAAAGGRR